MFAQQAARASPRHFTSDNSGPSADSAEEAFFKADAVAIVEAPHRASAGRNAAARQWRGDLIKRHVGSPNNEAEQ